MDLRHRVPRVRRLDAADALLAALREWFVYPPGEKRATGYLTVVFQAYQDGTATTDWHTDAMPQLVLSLGAPRRFGLGDEILTLEHGDAVVVPAGVPHCVFADPEVSDERCSIVFRGAQ